MIRRLIVVAISMVLTADHACADEAEEAAVALVKKLNGVFSRDGNNIITAVNMSDTKLKDADLKILVAGFPDTKDLGLSATLITNAALKEVKNLKKLEHLSLAKTAVTDACLKEVRDIKTLTLLYINGTRITPAGVKSVKAALPKCNVQGP